MTVSSTATTQSSGGTQDNGSSPVVRRQLDPSVLLIMVAAAAVYSLHGFQEALETETSIFAYGGQQVLEGTPPYVSVFNVIGPMGHLLAAFGVLVARGLALRIFLACAYYSSCLRFSPWVVYTFSHVPSSAADSSL